MRITFTGLTPYTSYTVVVRAKAAGEVGPAAQDQVITPAEGDKDICAQAHLFRNVSLVVSAYCMNVCMETPCLCVPVRACVCE